MSETNKIFVGNLSYDCTSDKLQNTFEECGHIEDVAVIMDRETGRSRGFGFVTFSSENEAEQAIKTMHETELLGRNITVRKAESRRGGGGGYGGGGRQSGGYGGGRQGRYNDYRSGGKYCCLLLIFT